MNLRNILSKVMKAFILVFSLIFIINCQTAKKIKKPLATQSDVFRDTTKISDQKALSNWLRSQPQQVRDDFKRDFIFSYEQIKQLVDTIKSKVQNDVKVGKQIWSTENLKVTKFCNGDNILQAQTQEEWEKAKRKKQAAWCNYEDSDDKQTAGILYNYYAINDPRGLAPLGWRMPLKNDWVKLFDELGGIEKAFYYLSLIDNSFKASPFFGHRRIFYDTSQALDGTIDTINTHSYFLPETCWWASDKLANDSANYIMLAIDDVGKMIFENDIKGRGCSIRCIKD
jgi:uncharacterized protein (TIGR02145 family)